MDEFWGIQVFGLGGVKGGRWCVLGVVDLHRRGWCGGQIENKRRTCAGDGPGMSWGEGGGSEWRKGWRADGGLGEMEEEGQGHSA